MSIKIGFIVLMMFVCISSAFCAPKQEIVLRDNTVLYGDVIGMENGVYKIKTQDVGLLSVSADNVKSISNKSAGNNITDQDVRSIKFVPMSPTNPAAVEAGVDALKRQMQTDPGVMGKISELQNDEDFMAAINDPEIMSAVNSGDIDALSSNPKFIKLMNSSAVANIGTQVEK